MTNPVLRGDLRARSGSQKVLSLEVFYLAVLGLVAFLGLPPEIGQADPARRVSLAAALLVVQAALVTYFTSAVAAQEIAVDGEKAPVDLLFAPFGPREIVAGKSAAALASAAFWVLLGAPFVVLAAGVRQESFAALAGTEGLIVVVAWGVSQAGLLTGITVEPDLSRVLVHWTVLLAIFAGTFVLPPLLGFVNPIAGVLAAQRGVLPWATLAVFAALGLLCDGMAAVRLGRFTAS